MVEPASDELVIEDPQVGAFLADPVSSEHLAPFMTGEKSLAEAALELGLSKSLMSYWVKKLLKLGLIRAARVEKRGRHHVSVYRASAGAFIVPIDLLAADPNKDVFEAAPFERTLKRSVVHFKHQSLRGRYLRYGREGGNVVLDVLPRQTLRPELTDNWARVGLSEAQAARFNGEINQLFNRLLEESDDGAKKYMVKLVLVEQWPQ
ncbi:MAG: hypothetical protein SFU83_05875 [Meiothermus sp.]|nr:hypothetical protein [Meiothermus sp.]